MNRTARAAMERMTMPNTFIDRSVLAYLCLSQHVDDEAEARLDIVALSAEI